MPQTIQSQQSFRFEDLKPSDPYYRAWLSLRRRTRADYLLGMVAMFCVVENLFVGWSASLFGLDPSLWLLLLMLLVYLPLTWYRGKWPCPRCGKPFFYSVRLIEHGRRG